MAINKALFVALVFVVGFLAAGVFFTSNLWAQYGSSSSSIFSEDVMVSKIPSGYGKLVAISGIYLYFQADNGSIYILKQRNQEELESRVVVIKRSE